MSAHTNLSFYHGTGVQLQQVGGEHVAAAVRDNKTLIWHQALEQHFNAQYSRNG